MILQVRQGFFISILQPKLQDSSLLIYGCKHSYAEYVRLLADSVIEALGLSHIDHLRLGFGRGFVPHGRGVRRRRVEETHLRYRRGVNPLYTQL